MVTPTPLLEPKRKLCLTARLRNPVGQGGAESQALASGAEHLQCVLFVLDCPSAGSLQSST